VLVGAAVLVVATLVASIVVMGPPSAQRDERLDARRLEDLRRIERLVDAHFERTGVLPVDLAALARPGLELPSDPASGTPYGYESLAGRAYRLCAVFATDSARRRTQRWEGDVWSHAAGRHCFDLRAPGRSDARMAEPEGLEETGEPEPPGLQEPGAP
jgi:hypothetical protein